MKPIMVIATCPGEDEARALASRIIENRLAACVQLSPVTSIYTWKERVCTEPEIRLVMKTRDDLYKALETLIRDNHAYEVPQIVKIPVDGGFQPYLDWVKKETG